MSEILKSDRRSLPLDADPPTRRAVCVAKELTHFQVYLFSKNETFPKSGGQEEIARLGRYAIMATRHSFSCFSLLATLSLLLADLYKSIHT